LPVIAFQLKIAVCHIVKLLQAPLKHKTMPYHGGIGFIGLPVVDDNSTNAMSHGPASSRSADILN
jgi:hypothetical protein